MEEGAHSNEGHGCWAFASILPGHLWSPPSRHLGVIVLVPKCPAFKGQFLVTLEARLFQTPSDHGDSLGGAVAGQVQRLLGRNAPIVCLQSQFVVTQSGLVKNWEPLHRVCGQRLDMDTTTGFHQKLGDTMI